MSTSSNSTQSIGYSEASSTAIANVTALAHSVGIIGVDSYTIGVFSATATSSGSCVSTSFVFLDNEYYLSIDYLISVATSVFVREEQKDIIISATNKYRENAIIISSQ